MLDQGTESLRAAALDRRALGAFTVYHLETAVAVVRAAERRGVPVILQASRGCFDDVGRAELSTMMLGVARAATSPVGVHLDHSTDLDEIAACVRLGYTSVMYDGSSREFEENVAMTAQAVEIAREGGVWIEGELGAVGGLEDSSGGAGGGALTDPAKAQEFVRRTGVDALAVAVGNVHGATDTPPHLDLDRLEEISSLVDIPLVLHGASGLPPTTVNAAVRRGVAKVNVNAELRGGYLNAVAGPHVGDDLRPVRRHVISVISGIVDQTLHTLGSDPTAREERSS